MTQKTSIIIVFAAAWLLAGCGVKSSPTRPAGSTLSGVYPDPYAPQAKAKREPGTASKILFQYPNQPPQQ